MFDYNNPNIRPQYALGQDVRPVGIPTGAVPQNATGEAIPQWALGQQPSQLAQNNTQATDANCTMTFDGQNLKLYNNGNLVNNLDAMSGQPDYQSAQYQNIANKGPIPEGTYYANQDQRQNVPVLHAIAGKFTPLLDKFKISSGNWRGGPAAWGTKRVWLEPDANTNTYGRDGFSIHGGWSKGSAGCIDIPGQTGQLSDYLDNCQDSVPVNVKYPKGW